ncbi:MAG TPA: hypothetical protein VFO46_05400 [Candidatus Sulfotelmatobacter sp.]|nr:hypothetical protein [Candidatus Sulfotelmatobacter sp.]
MNARLASQLVGLYPQKWRTRYGEEFQTFLETYPSHVQTILNVIGGALYERVLSLGRLTMDRRQSSLALMLYAYLSAVAGSINFYWSVADTPLGAAMHSHPWLFTSWNLVRGGSLLAAVAVAMVGSPVSVTILRTALSNRRWDVLYRLAVPPFAALVILAWMAAAASANTGHWVPTPWDVTGDWTAPQNWPPLANRWTLSSVTFVLMIAGLVVSAISVRQAIRRSDLSRHRRLWFTVPSTLLAGSVAVMTFGVLTWGWLVQRYAASEFHLRNGGLFTSTNVSSWALSSLVFLVATVVAIQGSRTALASEPS